MDHQKDRIFGSFLQKNRKIKNLTLENIGKAIYKTPSQIRLVEKGVYSLSQEEKNQAAKLLGFSGFEENLHYQPYFDHLLEKLDNLFFHQDQDEINKLLIQIHNKKSKWESSSLFFLIPVFELIPYRYEKENEQSRNLIKEIELYTDFMTSFELFFYYSLQGVIAYQGHQIEQARFFFEKALIYDQSRIGLYIQLAIVYQTLEYRQKCLNCIDKASHLLLQNPDVYRMLQLSLLYTSYRGETSISYKAGIQEKINLYNACLSANVPSLAKSVLKNISYMYICNEDYLNGIVYAKKSLALNDEPSSNCHWFIPYCYWKLGEKEEGQKWVDAYRALPSRNTYVSDMCMAIDHLLNDRITEGIVTLESVHQYLLESQEMDCLLFLLD